MRPLFPSFKGNKNKNKPRTKQTKKKKKIKKKTQKPQTNIKKPNLIKGIK